MQIFYVVEKVGNGEGGDAYVAHTPQLMYEDSHSSAVGCGDTYAEAIDRLRQHAAEALQYGNKPSGCHVDYKAFCKDQEDETLEDIVSWGHLEID